MAASPVRSTCQVLGCDPHDGLPRLSPSCCCCTQAELHVELQSIRLSLYAVDELPAALQLSSAEWAERYHFPKPGAGMPVVLQCRTQRRASWAAQLAADAGLHNVLVYKQVIQAQQGRPFLLTVSLKARLLFLWLVHLL
jgi:rhodanese-related sulfurtransferase